MPLTLMTLLLALGALAALIALCLAFWVSPRLTILAWLLAIFLVPVWVGATVGFHWAAITVLTLLAIAVHGLSLRLLSLDLCVIAFVGLVVALFVLGEVRLSPLVIAVLEWVIPYFWGRIALARVPGDFITKTIAAVATGAAVLVLLEFTTDTNWFVLIPGSGLAHSTWSPLQERGGFIRVEGAFGHSIALGASLAMSAAFVIASRWPTVLKLLSVVLLGTAVVLTFSRIGMVSFALTVGLALLLLRETPKRARIMIGSALGAAALLVTPFLLSVFQTAGEEAEGSASYRADLFVLLDQVRLFGGAGSWQDLVVGDTYLGFYARSTDSALISVLLRFGYVPTALFFAVYVVAIVVALKQGIGPAGIAILGQLPSLFAVALITQYGMYFWFVVGLTVSAAAIRPTERQQSESVSGTLVERASRPLPLPSGTG